MGRNTESFYVTTLGETPKLRNVNIRALRDKLGRTITDRDIEREFVRLSRKFHAPAEHDLYIRHTRLVKRFGSNLWRFYGERNRRGMSSLWLSTEMVAFVDESSVWADIRALAKKHGFKTHKIIEGPSLGLSWRSEGNGKRTVRTELFVDPDYGRDERQVSLDIDVMTWNYSKVGKMIKAFEASMASSPLDYDQYRVSVC